MLISFVCVRVQKCLCVLNAYNLYMDCKEKFRSKDQQLKWAREAGIDLPRICEVEKLRNELVNRLEHQGIRCNQSVKVHINSQPAPGAYNIDDEADMINRNLILKMIIAGAFYPTYFVGSRLDINEAYRLVSGNDLHNTVQIKNLPYGEGVLYNDKLLELFKPCAKLIHIEYEATKAYVQLKSKCEAVASNVNLGVYLAVQMRMLRLPMRLRRFTPAVTSERLGEFNEKRRANNLLVALDTTVDDDDDDEPNSYASVAAGTSAATTSSAAASSRRMSKRERLKILAAGWPDLREGIFDDDVEGEELRRRNAKNRASTSSRTSSSLSVHSYTERGQEDDYDSDATAINEDDEYLADLIHSLYDIKLLLMLNKNNSPDKNDAEYHVARKSNSVSNLIFPGQLGSNATSLRLSYASLMRGGGGGDPNGDDAGAPPLLDSKLTPVVGSLGSLRRLTSSRIVTADKTDRILEQLSDPRFVLPPEADTAKLIDISITNTAECGHFWAQINDSVHKKIIQDIHDRLNTTNGFHLKLLTDVHENSLCVTHFVDDESAAGGGGGAIYRARILHVDKVRKEVRLHYVDYGNYETKASNEIFHIPSDVRSYPFQAIECRLANIRPSLVRNPNGVWTPGSTAHFGKLVEDAAGVRTHQMRVVSLDQARNVCFVELYVRRTPSGASMDVSQQLVDESIAERPNADAPHLETLAARYQSHDDLLYIPMRNGHVNAKMPTVVAAAAADINLLVQFVSFRFSRQISDYF